MGRLFNYLTPMPDLNVHYFRSKILFYCCSDGKLEVVVPSFVHYLEVLEGSDGDKLAGRNYDP